MAVSKINELREKVGEQAWDVLREHLMGGTSANWLARELKESGFNISPTTLKEYRAKERGRGNDH